MNTINLLHVRNNIESQERIEKFCAKRSFGYSYTSIFDQNTAEIDISHSALVIIDIANNENAMITSINEIRKASSGIPILVIVSPGIAHDITTQIGLSFYIQKGGEITKEDFQPVLDKIVVRTGMPISLEGVFRWVVFLPSRQDDRVPVANRNFGVFDDGEIKIRGLEMRRHDTPPLVYRAQAKILSMLAASYNPNDACVLYVVKGFGHIAMETFAKLN